MHSPRTDPIDRVSVETYTSTQSVVSATNDATNTPTTFGVFSVRGPAAERRRFSVARLSGDGRIRRTQETNTTDWK